MHLAHVSIFSPNFFCPIFFLSFLMLNNDDQEKFDKDELPPSSAADDRVEANEVNPLDWTQLREIMDFCLFVCPSEQKCINLRERVCVLCPGCNSPIDDRVL